MAFGYQKLDKSARDAVRARLADTDPEPEYEGFLTAWEEAHVAHRALRDAALADGNEEEVASQEKSIAALEASILNVRAGKRPDGEAKEVKPKPEDEAVVPEVPAEPVTPTPSEPVTPAPAEPAAPVTPAPTTPVVEPAKVK